MTARCKLDHESNLESGLSNKFHLKPDNLKFNPGFLLEHGHRLRGSKPSSFRNLIRKGSIFDPAKKDPTKRGRFQ